MKTTLILGILALAIFNLGGERIGSGEEKEMVKVMIMYPGQEGKSFDMDYYSTKHMPMTAELFGDVLKQYTIEQGMRGRTSAEPAPYIAIGTFYFSSITDYENAFGPNAEKILADIPNYTDIRPKVQISKVVR